MNTRPGGTHQGRHTMGCSNIGRPARAPSNVVRMREQQLGFGDKTKSIKVFLMIAYPQSVVALYIYMVGRSCPVKTHQNLPNLSLKI
jgi:hypothetical protein